LACFCHAQLGKLASTLCLFHNTQFWQHASCRTDEIASLNYPLLVQGAEDLKHFALLGLVTPFTALYPRALAQSSFFCLRQRSSHQPPSCRLPSWRRDCLLGLSSVPSLLYHKLSECYFNFLLHPGRSAYCSRLPVSLQASCL
jgi:hypothetical protein